MNHYELLEVSERASSEVIDASWKALMKLAHPDRNPGSDETRVMALNDAHDILANPATRRIYDAELRREREQKTQQRNAEHWPNGAPPQAMATVDFEAMAVTMGQAAAFGLFTFAASKLPPPLHALFQTALQNTRGPRR